MERAWDKGEIGGMLFRGMSLVQNVEAHVRGVVIGSMILRGWESHFLARVREE